MWRLFVPPPTASYSMPLCQVETCFRCSGQPSVCATEPLGTPCDDGNQCTTVFDESVAPPSLFLRSRAPAGGACAGEVCWKRSGDSGFSYRDRDATPEGLTALAVRAGGVGQTRAQVMSKGPRLHFRLATRRVPVPLRVQLQATDGICFEARYDAAGVIMNDGNG
jgi:hypothetical protein